MLLETRNLSKTYSGKVAALEDISLSILQGEWVSIMGPSGSGKTTLLNLLAGLDHSTSGKVLFKGQDLSQLSQKELAEFRRNHIGLVFQQPHLIPYLSALENVMVAQYYHSMTDEAEARQALEKVGLKDRLTHLPGTLSGGEQQRVCIARALINAPEIILLDEPTGNLDETSEDQVIELLWRLHSEGHTILMVTHDPKIGNLAERKILLEHGHLVTSLGEILGDKKEDILETLWVGTQEKSEPSVPVRRFRLSKKDPAFKELERIGFIRLEGDRVTLEPKGLSEAEDSVRRHRLAECLLVQVVGLKGPVMNEAACQFEHALHQGVDTKICTLLGHPSHCPHGKTIPRGSCCDSRK